MLKRPITYEDFNGDTVTDIFYFHLAKSELVEMEVGSEGGLGELMKKIVETRDYKGLVAEFKKLILAAYGQKSEDGKRFIKNESLREEFSQTAAYQALFMELATSDDAAASFIKGIVPKDMSLEIDKEMKVNAGANSGQAFPNPTPNTPNPLSPASPVSAPMPANTSPQST